MEKFKPCPSCGGEVEIAWDYWNGVRYCFVECSCGFCTGVYKDLEELVEHWSERIE